MNTSRITPIQSSSPVSKRHSKQSLNHLLNFTLPPRVQHPPPLPRRPRRSVRQLSWNKEKFINAQYRFVVRPTGDYTVHFADPDIYFQWKDILQVIISRPASDGNGAGCDSAANCPICLSLPVAPRITRCGHVFCYPCILHYLETGDNTKWNRCPICFDPITSGQLKVVQWSYAPCSPPPAPHHKLTLRLMERPHNTTLALPRSSTWPSLPSLEILPPHEAPFHFLPDVLNFSKFMLATPDQLVLDISRDIEDLDREAQLLLSYSDTLGISFVHRAREQCVAMLRDAQKMEEDGSLMQSIEEKRLLLREAQRTAEIRAPHAAVSSLTFVERPTPEHTQYQSPEALVSTGLAPILLPMNQGRSARQRRNVNPPPHSTPNYIFYQAATGANTFLHPLDTRILLSHFGTHAAFPNEITVGVASSSESTVDDDLRRRCRYLGHLAEGADVVFIEADLEAVVGLESLKPFENVLKIRLSRRKDPRIKAEGKEMAKLMDILSVSQSQVLLHDRGDERQITDESQDGDGDEGYSDGNVDFNVESGASVAHPPQAAISTTGAWGARSFASAAHSGVASIGQTINPPRSRLARNEPPTDWNYDEAWHDLEEAQLNGKRGRSKKLILLGGGGGRRGRN
ncbi:uncharacterized protein EI90DRAFT_3145704 [Cantharellus anzutake]|uniref:uncharacterized protein n=1 Tax=Cantharellus anzutake TaxID=1750568 RepID=UPI001903349B|nr:uncharacterized protein EI90DRAFT_3145704 [Cantharellus anzutake]KAF8330792.1 hypothetical protein EI90DRAFT_3145704 [Cantharellus anzutake]